MEAEKVARDAMIGFAELRKGIDRIQNFPKGEHNKRLNAILYLRDEAEKQCQYFKGLAGISKPGVPVG